MRHVKMASVVLFSAAVLLGGSTTASAQDAFIGEIKWVGFNFAPRGWAQCNGQILSIAQNTALFSLLGTMYGGNGQTTFALPDMRGRVPVHAGQGPGLSFFGQGETRGAETVALSISQMPSHSHALGASSAEATETSPSGSSLGTKQRVPLYKSANPDVQMNGNSIGSNGGNQPFSIVQPSLGVNCIIALEGIFPARN
jgi:microcystin-dependent protein